MSLILLSLALAGPPHAARPSAPPPVVVRQGAHAPFALDHSAASRRGFVEGLRHSPGADVFAAIQRNYPEDYEAMIDRLLDVAINSGGDPAVAANGAFRETYAFIRSKSGDLINAPAASLLIVSQRTLAFYRALAAADVGFCARFAMGTATDPLGFPRALAPQMATITAATIDAAGAGHRAAEHPADRATLIPADAVAWMARMRALDAANEVVPLLAAPGAAERATPALQCRLGTMMYEAIEALPPDQGARILAYLLSETMRNRQP